MELLKAVFLDVIETGGGLALLVFAVCAVSLFIELNKCKKAVR